MTANIVYLGNCQAQAFESLSGHLKLNVDVHRVPAVYTIEAIHEETISSVLDRADFIFSQRLSSSYPVHFLRNEHLRKKYGEKVIIWPNIYFDGYFPGLKYIYGKHGKVVGPLRDYHFDWIYEGWKRGEDPNITAKIPTSKEFWGGRKDFVEASIMELKKREKAVDVRISDYLVEHFRAMKLFHSMNHPHTSVLVEMLRRLFYYTDLPFNTGSYEDYPYHLNQVEIPSFPVFRDLYRPTFDDEELHYKGAEISPGTCDVLDTDKIYNNEELVGTFYRIYDKAMADN